MGCEFFAELNSKLKPFKADFKSQRKYQPEQYSSSCKGRVYCLIKLVSAPIMIPFKIIQRICQLVVLIFMSLAIATFVRKKDQFTVMKNTIISLVNNTGIVLFTPLCIAAAHIRYLFGVIHPRAVFQPNPQGAHRPVNQ